MANDGVGKMTHGDNISSRLSQLPPGTLLNLRNKGSVEANKEFWEDQLRQKNSTDLDIICSDGYIQVHRCLLMGASAFIRELLIDKNIIDTCAITVDDMTVGEMAVMMRLLYTGDTIITGGEDQAELFNANMRLLGLPLEDLLHRVDSDIGMGQMPARMAVFRKNGDGYRRSYTDTDPTGVSNGIDEDISNVDGNVYEEGQDDQNEQHVVVSEDTNEGVKSKATREFGSDNDDTTSADDEDEVLNLDTIKGIGERKKVVPDVGLKRSLPQNPEVTSGLAVLKRRKLGTLACTCKNREPISFSSMEVNIPDKDGYVPLLRAIMEGRCVKCIRKILSNRADVNVKSSDGFQLNAAHIAMRSLRQKKLTQPHALEILELLVAKGFKLINDTDSQGVTPLLSAMQCKDLNEELLTWFHESGADFNFIFENERGYSNVLAEAIKNHSTPLIIRKILEFGCKPDYGDKLNALHLAAICANKSAMEILMDHPDTVFKDPYNHNPLHFLFTHDGLDYQPCLELLLKKGVDFDAECRCGYDPLVKWIKCGKANPFPTLMNLKDCLPFTQDIASYNLTDIMADIEGFQKYLPSSSEEEPNEFVQFVIFLISEKDAELRLDVEWMKKNKHNLWVKLKLTRKVFQELSITHFLKCKGNCVELSSETMESLEFDIKSCIVTGPVEFTMLAFNPLKYMIIVYKWSNKYSIVIANIAYIPNALYNLLLQNI